MSKGELDKLRGSTLYKDETLYVIHDGRYGNFPANTPIPAKPRMACKSNLPYPQPKWIACDYYIKDTGGNSYKISTERYGKLIKGFKWYK